MPTDRQVWVSDLVLQKDIVDRLGIDPTVLANLAGGRRNTAEFPRPVQGRGNRGIWLWPEVAAWYDTWRPQTPEALARSGAGRHRDPRPCVKGRSRRVA